MTALAPTLQSFFTNYLIGQRAASQHTITAYRDTWRLLLDYTQQHTGIAPSDLDISDLNPDLVAGFLTHLQQVRGNSARTRNARLAAIHSLFTHAALRHPEHAGLIAQVLAIPTKNTHRTVLTYLTDAEVTALLDAPDRTTWTGRRDHLILLAIITTGMRVSELTGLTRRDTAPPPGAHLACHGKGRKDRIMPIDTTTTTIPRSRGRISTPPAPAATATGRGSRPAGSRSSRLTTRWGARGAGSPPRCTWPWSRAVNLWWSG